MVSDYDPETSREFLQALAQLSASTYERAWLFMAMSEIGGAAAIAVEHNRNLEALLDELVNKLVLNTP